MRKHTKSICKRVLALCMSVLMLLTAWVFVAPTKAAAADVWDGNYSDSSGFYNNEIHSARGLAYFLNRVANGNTYSGTTIRLKVDVDLNNRDLCDANTYYTNGFEGTFDGENHTISNFRMTHENHRVAMFRTAKNATFKNVTVTDVFVDDWDNNNKKNGFAIFVGYGEGNLTFENVHISGGYIYGYNYVGGLVGEYGANDILTLTNCSNSALIYADHDRAGGLVGHSKGRVYATGCSNTGEIYAGYSDAGGIAGWIEDDESYFVNCSNTGKVATDACAGGIMGYFGSKSNDNKMTITGCSNTGEIISRGNGYCAGGIAGKLDTDATHTLENNVNRGSVSAKEDVGGIVGSNLGGGVWRNNKNYGNVYCDNDNAAGILGEVEDDKQEFYNCYNTGAIEGKNSTSGILGYGNAAAHTFSHCGNSGYIVSRSSSAGGIYAYGGNSQPTIEDCWNIGTVRAYNDAGGILGHTEHHSYIRRCWNAGSIETYNHNENGAHGGIVGQTSDLSGSSNDNPNMTDCFNWGPVSGGRDDGGLIGKIKDGRTPYYITNSYNAGQVTGTRPFAIIAYGGNVGNNVYYDNGVAMGTVQGTSISDSDLRNSSGFSGNYCKNTWGVRIGSTTYYYPILNWYRNMFMFHLKFVDDPSGTNVYWDGEYNSAFYAPNPTRRGYTTDHWFLSTDSGKTIAIPTEIVTCGVTPCTDSLLMTQHTDEITTIDNTSVFNLTWERIKQKLDMNAVLNDEYMFDNIDFFTADVYVNGIKVADDVNDFYDDLYYEDTYEITDIKVADGYRFVGAYTGEHEGRQQSGLTGQMDIDLIEVAPEFKTLHTVTVTPGTGTTISGVETGTYAYGDTVTITAAAETGYDQTAPVLKVNGSVAASGSTITITGDTTITTDNLSLNTYTLNFYNGDNEHPYVTQTYTHGDAFTAPANPTYTDGTDADYEFVGWAAAAYPDEGWDVEVELPETVTASADYFSLYDGYVIVTWKNGNETLAGPTRTMVGTVPAYTGEMPTTADAQYTYTAIGWNTDPNATTALDPIPALGTSNVTYYAVYDKNDEAHRTVNKYTITWKNWDGTVLATNEVAYGTTPVYSGPTPTREDDAQYHYTTYSWDPMISAVSGPATYTAQFDYVIQSYTVTFKDQNGDVIGTPQEVSYGEDATPPDDLEDYADANSHYTFDGWSGYIDIRQDTTIQATFTAEAHTFDQAVATADYKASNADCTNAATYYYSCTCGYKGTETFESGDPLGHTMTSHDAMAGADCEHYGTVAYYHCSICEKDFDDEVGTNELTDLSDNVYGPHAYAFHSFVWAADFTTAQAKYVCGNNANHIALYTATVTPSAHASTCTEAGYTVYTATYDGHTDIKTVTGDPATGHTYAAPAAEDWTWTKNGDAYTATATAICSQCAEGTDGHTTTLTVTAELTEDVPATADVPGHKTYTGTAAVGDQTFTATKTDDYYYVTVTPGTGTTIAGAETGEYEAGTVLTVTAAAQAGYDDSTLTLNVNGAAVENGSTVAVTGQTTITTDDLTAFRYTFTYIAKFGDVIGETLFTQTNLPYGTMIVRPLDNPVDVRRGAEVWTFDSYSDGYAAGQGVPVTGDKTIYVLFTLTDQPAKYKVTFLNDDNYTKVAEAEYEWQETVVVPETPVSTHRTVSEDYTFLGWTPEVAATVTADATYVATYETEAHARIYHVKWVYGRSNELTAKEEDLPYDTVFTAETIPADVFVKDDLVTHDRYSWETRAGTALADHIGGSTTEAVITGSRSIDRHTGEPDYEWVGSDETGYTKCIATMTCADCGEALSAEYTLDSDDVYTHIGENCQDQGYTSYSAWLNGSGVNSYFENQNKKVYGDYGDHYYPSSSVEIVWNTTDLSNVTCKVTQPCYFCDHVEEEPGEVSVYEQTPATCVSPETTVFKAHFEHWGDQYSEEIQTAPIDPDAHKYDGWDARPDEARCTRPVYDAATETWSKGTLVIPCANTYTLGYDYNPETGEPTVTFHYTVADYAAHDKVLTDLDRADYEAFDEAYAKLQTISGLDIADDKVVYSYETYDWQSGEMVTRDVTFAEFKETYLEDILTQADRFPQNLITIPAGAEGHAFDEQPRVDQMTSQMQIALNLFFNENGTVKEELLSHYTVTFTLKDGSVTTYSDKLKGDVVNVPAAPAEVDGYAFLGWTLAGSDDIALATDAATYTVAGDAAFTAKYAASLTTYTVTFVVDGEAVSIQTVEHGGSAIAPDVAAYVNSGDNHKKLSAWDVSFTNVTSDLTVSAIYETKAHEWQDGEVTLAATCMATGTQAQSCVCGATNVKTLPKDPANHTGNNTTTRENEVAPTCTAAGSYTEVVTCECGAVISSTSKTEAALGHNFGAWTQTAAPTCDTAGQESKTCDRCGATESRALAALGHSWGAWTVTRQATCTAEGTKTRTCTRDASHTETVTIPKLPHADNNGDNKCDSCGTTIDTSFRCSFCDTYEANREKPVIGWFYIIIHFFIHLFAQMKAWK